MAGSKCPDHHTESKYRIARRALQSIHVPEVFVVLKLVFWLRRGRSGNTLEN